MDKSKHIKGHKSILELINYFDTEEKYAEYLAYQRWGDNPTRLH